MWLKKSNILAILFLGLLFRLINLSQSLWHDESGNVVYAKSLDLWQYVVHYPIGDFHPNGYFAILWVWGHLFGFSEISVRMPSVIFGVLTIVMVYLIGKKFFSEKTGLIAAILLATAPLHIYYSQEARMYSFAAFAATFSFFLLIQFINKAAHSFWLYSLGIALVLYSDYVAYLIIVPQIVYVLIVEKRLLKKLFLAFFIGGLLALPTLLILPSQFIYGIHLADRIGGWKEAVGAATLKNYLLLPVKILVGRISIDNGIIYSAVIGLTAIPYLFLFIKSKFRFDKNNFWLLLWLIIPVVLAILISPFIPIFSYFRLLFILPAFYLLVACLVSRFSGKAGYLILGIIVVIQIIASSVYLFNINFHREDWKGSVAFIEQKSELSSIILFENDELFTGYRYYNIGKIPAVAAFSKIPAKSPNDLVGIDNLLKNRQQVYLYEYLVGVTDPEKILEKQLILLGYRQQETYNFRGIGFVKAYRCCNISE